MFTTKQLVALLVSLLVVGSPAGVAAAQQGPSAGEAVVVDEGETVDDDLDAVGGTVVVAGTVTGDVSVTAETIPVTETGVVNGNFDAVVGSATLEGSVGGSLAYNAATATADAAAVVDGGVRRVDNLTAAAPVVAGTSLQFGQFEGLVIPGQVVSGYWFLANFVVSTVIVLVAPGFAGRVMGLGTKQAVRNGSIGLLAIVAIPIVLLLLFLTIVGIPLSLAGGVGFLLVLWVAGVYGALVLGTQLLSLADYDNCWVALFAGLFVPAILDFVPLGGILEFVVLLVGLSAFALALRGEFADDGGESVSAPDEGPREGSPMA